LTVISVVALLFTIFWEWRVKEPIIDLHLFKDRNFASANVMMFMVGFVLLSSTLLLPQFTQTLLGYTAERAGMALSPGGFTLVLLMPFVGFLLTRFDPRRLMMFGFVMVSVSLFYMTGFDLNVDFKTLVLARILQTSGVAFLFIPINTAAYSYLPPGKNNAASGLINLARNIGGSVGISFVTTMLARRAQHHQATLSSHLATSNPNMQRMLQNTAHAMQAHGYSPADAMTRAYMIMQNVVLQQATMLAYVDNFWLLGILILCMLPFVFLMKKPRKGGAIAVH